jgi:hypothetical protein
LASLPRDAIRPIVLARYQDLAGELRQAVVVVAQVEPPVMPTAVRRDELRRDIEITSTRVDLKGTAASLNRTPHSPLARLLGKVLHLEKVEL